MRLRPGGRGAAAGRSASAGSAIPTVADYLSRVEELASECRVGLAPHSVRAVPRDWLEEIAGFAQTSGMVVHIHANEQRREVDECLAEHGMRPIELLAEIGLLTARTTIVHATHVSERELDLLAGRRLDRLRLPDHRGQPRRRLPARPPSCWSGRAGLHRHGLEHDHRSDLAELREIEHCARRLAERRNVLVPAGDGRPDRLPARDRPGNGARALGLDGPAGEVEVDLDTRSLAGVERRTSLPR